MSIKKRPFALALAVLLALVNQPNSRFGQAAENSFSLAVITNDIYTQEDAEALMRMQILPADRVIGVETGGCPHTAIREDASINLAAVAKLQDRILS